MAFFLFGANNQMLGITTCNGKQMIPAKHQHISIAIVSMLAYRC